MFEKIFGLLKRKVGGNSVIEARERNYEIQDGTGDLIKYQIIALMEEKTLSGKERNKKKYVEALKKALKRKLKGLLYIPKFHIAEFSERTNGEWGLCFGLTQASDFEVFSEAMKTIDGIIEIKKTGSSWN